jgi:pyrroloquinoline quinone biosynthesis protein E
MPCHAAGVIKTLQFPNVRERDLSWIWNESPAFRRFRGEDWMREPCASCERRSTDFGGCRCQAMLVLGDATATDPVCSLSPDRAKIDEVIAESLGLTPEPVYRKGPRA